MAGKGKKKTPINSCLGYYQPDATCDGNPDAAEENLKKGCPLQATCKRLMDFAAEHDEEAEEIASGFTVVEDLVAHLDEAEAGADDEDDAASSSDDAQDEKDEKDGDDDLEDDETEDDDEDEDDDDQDDETEDDDEDDETDDTEAEEAEDNQDAEDGVDEADDGEGEEPEAEPPAEEEGDDMAAKKSKKKAAKKDAAPKGKAKKETAKKTAKKDAAPKGKAKKDAAPKGKDGKPECFADQDVYDGKAEKCVACKVGADCRRRIYADRAKARRAAAKGDAPAPKPAAPKPAAPKPAAKKPAAKKPAAPKAAPATPPAKVDDPILAACIDRGWEVRSFGDHYFEVARQVGLNGKAVFLRVFPTDKLVRAATAHDAPAGLRADAGLLHDAGFGATDTAPPFSLAAAVTSAKKRKAILAILAAEPTAI